MALPTVWELIIPNLNTTTVIGIFLIIVAILGFKFSEFFSFIGSGKVIKKISFTLILIAVVLIWGVSMFQDFINTIEGQVIFWCVVLIAFFAIILFYEPGKISGGKKNGL